MKAEKLKILQKTNRIFCLTCGNYSAFLNIIYFQLLYNQLALVKQAIGLSLVSQEHAINCFFN